MFFYEGIMAGGRAIKSVCACLCCCICAGPILVVVGIVIIASPNTRKEDVAAYNAAVTAWKSGTAEADVDGWLPGTIGNSPATKVTNPVVVDGSSDDVSNPSIEVPFVAAATSFQKSISVSYKLKNVDEFSLKVPAAIARMVTLSCSNKRGCTPDSMQTKCRSRYPSATYSGQGCRRKGSCGMCKYSVYVKDICAVAKKKSSESKSYTRDTSKTSCKYPFTSTSFGTTSSKPADVDLSLRASDDPYIALQRITKGSNNFGMTKGEKVGLGFAFIGIGILLIFCIIVFIFILYKLIKMALGKKGGAQDPHSLGGQLQQYPSQQQQEYLPQPPQKYPLQQPEPIPATAYGYDGQPMSGGYGAPPAPQVQPGYGYGYNQPQPQHPYNNNQ